jgi:hypothetical protein
MPSLTASSFLPGSQERRYLPFPDARETVRALGLQNQQVRSHGAAGILAARRAAPTEWVPRAGAGVDVV